ncbi:thiamine phosphate synthase [Roseomonas sp. JC162]|uniref:Thiamine phosphate synthase n=1 Tax=Neoroseomonas marina TaxID=1232220 RepID=A0A848EA01_9PROT|nr:thiamine phosphate synthase [Neoroseomonas marina]NMJ40982.1 thiamine phosphate synthase [Neoroseomonas marina]
MGLPAPIAAAARACRPPVRRGRRLPALWLFSDPVRLPDPRDAAAALPRGSGVVARGATRNVLVGLAQVARRRGLVVLVGGDGRAALAVGGGLHLPDRHGAAGILPVLAARRGGRPGAVLTLAAHGSARAAARVRRLRPDVVFLSPLFPTASHPGAPALGPLRWLRAAAALRRAATAGVVALGGIGARTARRVPRRAAGVAAIGGLAQQAVSASPQCLR